MKYKQLVLERYPEACINTLPAGLYVVISAPRPDSIDLELPDRDARSPAAAWRAAYYWCVRNMPPARFWGALEGE